MKKILTLLFLLTTLLNFAQVPQGISYQAIALNTAGAPVVSSNVGIRLSVLDNSASGTVLYTETQTKTTNPQGLFNLVIGQGTVVSGTFNTINWGTNLKFLKVEMDVAGGTTYVLVGTTQLLSVPYALAAGSLTGTNANDSIESNKTSNFAFASSNGNVYAFNTETNLWYTQSGNISSTGGLIGSNKNFAYASTNGNVYAFSSTTNVWVAQYGNISSTGGLIGSNGNFAYASTNGNVYAFNAKTNTWTAQYGNISSTGGLIGANGNFAYASTNGNVYAFNAKTNTWTAQYGNISSTGGLIGANGNFSYASTNGNVYAFNSKTNTWTAQYGNISSIGGLIYSSSN